MDLQIISIKLSEVVGLFVYLLLLLQLKKQLSSNHYVYRLPRGHSGKESTCQCRRQEMWVLSLGREDPLEESMATHSSILAWRIPEEEPGGLQSMGSKKSQTLTGHTYTHYIYNSMHPQCTGDIKLENTQFLQKVKTFLVCVPRVLGIGSHRYINR